MVQQASYPVPGAQSNYLCMLANFRTSLFVLYFGAINF